MDVNKINYCKPKYFSRKILFSNYSVLLRLAVSLIITPESLVMFFELIYSINSYNKYSVFLPVAYSYYCEVGG